MNLLFSAAQMAAKSLYDSQTLEFWYTGNGSATFDPEITTSKSTTIVWQTSDGQNVTTTGTSHAFSYTPASGGPYRCTARVNGGLGLVTGINCNSDLISTVKNTIKCSMSGSVDVGGNISYYPELREFQPNYSTFLSTGSTSLGGTLLQISRSCSTFAATASRLTGPLSDLPSLLQTCYLYSSTGIAPASIAHLTAIRDIRIYSMGWTTAQNTAVLLSAWNARASYTYASGIQLRISAPTGTPGTEPPAEGVSNDDWSWNAETSRHDPLTGYAVIGDLQTDFYSEGFNPWVVTIV